VPEISTQDEGCHGNRQGNDTLKQSMTTSFSPKSCLSSSTNSVPVDRPDNFNPGTLNVIPTKINTNVSFLLIINLYTIIIQESLVS
jgi:hypothetical protein